jgi:hypothetical protein
VAPPSANVEGLSHSSHFDACVYLSRCKSEM